MINLLSAGYGKRHMGLPLVMGAALLLITTNSASAVIMYELSGQAAGGSTATGTITTNGVIGSVALGDVVSSAITVDDGVTSILLPSLPTSFGGIATASTLSFDGSSTIEFRDAAFDNYWQLRITGGSPANNRMTISVGGVLETNSAFSRPSIIAVAVPEPSSFMCLGLAAAGLATRRRRRI